MTGGAQAQGSGFGGALFDTHLHYEEADARFMSPAHLLDLLDRNSIDGVLVSSVPDSNALLLRDLAPRRVVAFARPFDRWKDKWRWQADPGVEARVAEELAAESYAGIGEFNLRAGQVELPGVDGVARLAERHDLEAGRRDQRPSCSLSPPSAWRAL